LQSLECRSAAPHTNAVEQVAAKWPQGLNDEEAITRLQSILIQACEGTRDLSVDRDYKSLRVPLIKRPDLSDVVPKYVRAHRDLGSFWSYIRKVSDKWQDRREHVWETFKPLFDRVEGRTSAPISASQWTGRRTPAQQAKIVLALAPDALQGIQQLLDEQARALHNGGPVDPEREEAIAALKALHRALGELIEMAETGESLAAQLTKVKRLKNAVFKWSVETFGLTMGGTPLTAQSLIWGAGVAYVVNVITKDITSAGAFGAAVTAMRGSAAAKQGQPPTR
jgi:hypothetical protein